MTRKLYKATVTVDIPLIIVGENPPDRTQILDTANEEWENSAYLLRDDMVVIGPTEVTAASQLPDNWEDAIPYGDNMEDLTVKEFLRKREEGNT